MKRSEFLKRLGLGLGAVVAAPALLAKENDYQKYLDDFKNQESTKLVGKPAPWSITQDFAEKLEVGQTYCYSMTIKSVEKDVVIIDNASLKQITIPPLEPGKYEFELGSGSKSIMVGNIEAK